MLFQDRGFPVMLCCQNSDFACYYALNWMKYNSSRYLLYDRHATKSVPYNRKIAEDLLLWTIEPSLTDQFVPHLYWRIFDRRLILEAALGWAAVLHRCKIKNNSFSNLFCLHQTWIWREMLGSLWIKSLSRWKPNVYYPTLFLKETTASLAIWS